MDLGIEDRVAVVTGGSKGIGYAIARELGEAGTSVVIANRTPEEGREAAAAIAEETGADTLAVPTDLTEEGDAEALVEETVDEFGSVDILVNNAGTIGSQKQFHDIPLEEWEDVYDLNLFGTVRVTRAALPHMREQGWGRVINIASEAGTQPDDYKPHYDSSKAAMINFTKNLSKAYSSDGVLVNAVSPATTLTPLVEDMFKERAEAEDKSFDQVRQEFIDDEKPGMVRGLERLGEPEETAHVAAFLASEKASWVTGSNYRVDGGSIFTMDS
ncbi:SDR family NAD(P)-dependent oxidoreductase [Halorubrum sp. CBA1125]|uniref:SDR family NAD(P)-dependent oxidoreductase n=1 Tax=Halorubrum sp. CBA1125 TaxID=2668072 RepID=UPI0018D2569F|nr:glucose 1-dehydrogenase [Halorubrum sp. CBA1125]